MNITGYDAIRTGYDAISLFDDAISLFFASRLSQLSDLDLFDIEEDD